MERPVEAETRIHVARKIIGRGDDCLERGAHEGVAMPLGARERAGIAPQEGKVGREILTERHFRFDSYSNIRCCEWLAGPWQPRAAESQDTDRLRKQPGPLPLETVEPLDDFFVSMATRAANKAPGMGFVRLWPASAQFFEPATITAAGAALSRGVFDLTFVHQKDGDRRRKSNQANVTDPAGAPRAKKKRPDKQELGSALRSVYQRTVEEDIPPEMLDLLGKLG